MSRRPPFLAGVALAICIVLPVQSQTPAEPPAPRDPAGVATDEQERAAEALRVLENRDLRAPDDDELFLDAARLAWRMVDRYYEPGTGFVRPLPDFGFATAWDVGSMLGAFYAANALGLMDDATYASRVDRLLRTLQTAELYERRVFNKWYNARTGGLVRRGRAGAESPGWSATDLGRLLIWLKIIGTDPRFAQRAEAVVRRNDFSGVVHDGYLWGEDVDARGRARVYQEGRIGYEQYAARGMDLWGYRADKALRLRENALPLRVGGQALYADYRRWDRLTSEPFLLWGLELGWDTRTATFVRGLLRAQEERFQRTGRLTMVGEDSIPQPPDYFYYYCVFANGREFAVDAQDPHAAEGPRWASAKTAFGFHALLPSAYTAGAVRGLAPARSATGWGAGVYEDSRLPTGALNVNTAGVILVAALVARDGQPVLAHAEARAARQ